MFHSFRFIFDSWLREDVHFPLGREEIFVRMFYDAIDESFFQALSEKRKRQA